jgi:hypothetical protein
MSLSTAELQVATTASHCRPPSCADSAPGKRLKSPTPSATKRFARTHPAALHERRAGGPRQRKHHQTTASAASAASAAQNHTEREARKPAARALLSPGDSSPAKQICSSHAMTELNRKFSKSAFATVSSSAPKLTITRKKLVHGLATSAFAESGPSKRKNGGVRPGVCVCVPLRTTPRDRQVDEPRPTARRRRRRTATITTTTTSTSGSSTHGERKNNYEKIDRTHPVFCSGF